ncbi:Ger(x)C family spore germination protein [Paenibacillus taiwanensis]|uniref:Ger(x)C family spore germination protein n=1 Tax=Paenibacillus taiwanensis TaxID=401638 RepID=UPI0005685A89|nr:Ger(x)C family spore germination protein [Paenibacillus taiwanensis]
MINRWLLLLVCLFTLSTVSGCFEQHSIENLTISMLVGIDVNENGQLIISQSSPVFSTEAKENEEDYEVISNSMRSARDRFDTLTLGLTSSNKAQVILIGKELTKVNGWQSLIDVFFRDSRNTVSARMVYVDGPVSEIINFKPKDKPRLPFHLSKLIDTALKRNDTTRTTIQDFHRQLHEKGNTPSLTAMRKEKDIILLGTALLNQQAGFVMNVTPGETKLLYILENKTRGEFPYTLIMPMNESEGIINKNILSFNMQKIKTKIKASYSDGKFKFNVHIKGQIYLTEKLFNKGIRDSFDELEQKISKLMKRDFTKLVTKLQRAAIDPAGFGMYARAYAYPEWKKAEKNWTDAFKEADVNVNVNFKLIGVGAIE